MRLWWPSSDELATVIVTATISPSTIQSSAGSFKLATNASLNWPYFSVEFSPFLEKT